MDSSPSAPSPNRNAKSHTLWVALSTFTFSSYVNLWFYRINIELSFIQNEFFFMNTCAATRACSIIVLASAVIPLTAQPKCSSISIIFSIELASNKVEDTRFSTAKTTPSEVWTPIAVVPSYTHPLISLLFLGISLLRGFTLMASIAYSTWKRRPSGEKVLTPRSYSERVKNIVVYR